MRFTARLSSIVRINDGWNQQGSTNYFFYGIYCCMIFIIRCNFFITKFIDYRIEKRIGLFVGIVSSIHKNVLHVSRITFLWSKPMNCIYNEGILLHCALFDNFVYLHCHIMENVLMFIVILGHLALVFVSTKLHKNSDAIPYAKWAKVYPNLVRVENS